MGSLECMDVSMSDSRDVRSDLLSLSWLKRLVICTGIKPLLSFPTKFSFPFLCNFFLHCHSWESTAIKWQPWGKHLPPSTYETRWLPLIAKWEKTRAQIPSDSGIFGPLLVHSKLHEKLCKSGSLRSRWQEELAYKNFIQENKLYTERWILLVKRGRKRKKESRSYFRRALRKWWETGNIFEQFLLAVSFLFPLGRLWSGCSSYGYVSRSRWTLQCRRSP